MDKRFLTIILIIIVTFVGIFALTKENNPADQAGNNSAPKLSNHTKGAGNKKVTLTEFGDFQCPACKQYYPLVKQVREIYGDDIKFQFRHFPLVQIHPNAMLGSRAAEAAGKQNKFFEMHDLLYENQDSWSAASNPTSILESYAQQLGLNVEQFKKDVADPSTSAAINGDIKEGQKLGANSTPTFAINGKKIEENPRSIDQFKKLIDDEIKKQTSSQ